MALIQRSELQKLAQYDSGGRPVVSLYLNVTPPRNFTSEIRSLIHRKKEQLRSAGVPERLLRQADGSLKRVADRVHGITSLEGTRLLVIFAGPDGLFQEYRLPVALPSRLYVEPHPYVRPLTLLLDEFDRYCVLVVDGRKARLFTMYLGEIQEDTGLLHSDTPSRVSEDEGHGARGPGVAGVEAWAGWREPKIQRHIEDHIHRHLKEVTERTFEVFKQQGFDRLIVGAPDGRRGKIYPMLEGHLHSYLRARLAGVFSGDPSQPTAELTERALEVARRHERKLEKELVQRLVEESRRPAGLAVLGIEGVLASVLRGQIHTLVVKEDFRTSGWECPKDRFLFMKDGRCPHCGAELVRCEDFVENILEQALAQGAEIEHVLVSEEQFDKYKIGALLRFRMPEGAS